MVCQLSKQKGGRPRIHWRIIRSIKDLTTIQIESKITGQHHFKLCCSIYYVIEKEIELIPIMAVNLFCCRNIVGFYAK